MTKPTAMISSLTFSGGECFQFSKNEKIILVGPNNSGKSQSLREILSVSQNGETKHTLVVKGLEILKEGTSEDLKVFLEQNAEYVPVHENYRYKNWQIAENQIRLWDMNYLRPELSGGFINNIDAKNRLNICEMQNSISPDEHKTVPQHVLYNDDSLMDKISGLFRQAFGKDLMFNFRGGSKLPIHVGESSDLAAFPDRAGNQYEMAVRKYPLLNQQGDGMKSYAGILFESLVKDLDVTLIDEPEAFLHPPQMRRLGETLSSEVKGQLIVSTHSSDILRGFLEGTRGNVRILRISRDNDVNHVSEASTDVIEELWSKPELRYSNALEGIFHEQTIICEDDSDCRLINAIADHLAAESDEQWQDTAYVPTGGKHGVPKVACILREIGVPVKAVFDFDFLSEKRLVETTVEAFGGDWREFEPDWKRVDAAVRAGKKPMSNQDIKNEIKLILDNSQVEDLPKRQIEEAMKQTKPWSDVKRYGVTAIPNGDAQGYYNSLRDLLEKIGIYLIPVGEIESFCPDIGGHGPGFVTKLLSTVRLGDARLSGLRNFVDRLHKGACGRTV